MKTLEDVIAELTKRLGPPNVRHSTHGRPWRRWDAEHHMVYVGPSQCHGHEVIHVSVVDRSNIRRNFAVEECGACSHYAVTASTLDEAMAVRDLFHRVPLAVIVECAAQVIKESCGGGQ